MGPIWKLQSVLLIHTMKLAIFVALVAVVSARPQYGQPQTYQQRPSLLDWANQWAQYWGQQGQQFGLPMFHQPIQQQQQQQQPVEVVDVRTPIQAPTSSQIADFANLANVDPQLAVEGQDLLLKTVRRTQDLIDGLPPMSETAVQMADLWAIAYPQLKTLLEKAGKW